jgi:hypothetical protein
MRSTSWHKLVNQKSKSRPSQRGQAIRSRVFRPQVERLESRELLSGAGSGTEQLRAAYGQIPLSFEANQGQTDAQVNFLSRGSGYALFLTPREAVLSLQKPLAPGTAADTQAPPGDVLRMQLVGGHATPQVLGLDELAGKSNYFVGNDPTQWRSNIATYGKVEYREVYPGIDLVYYGNQQQLEYDFVVAPGANPGVITLSFQGTEDLALDAQGNLVLHTAGGDVVEHAPILYQEKEGGRQAIFGQYVVAGKARVGFQVGAYDTSQPLIIDPVLSYSTYLGGSRDDQGQSIAVDAVGNAYVTGTATSLDFPTTPGAFQSTVSGTGAFVTKLNASGSALVYSTYLGGGQTLGTGIAVDAAGNAYITGKTWSVLFPTTPGAFQPTKGGGGGTSTAFVTKLNPTGTALVYSSYLGGSGSDGGNGIAVDAAGNAYVTGYTRSTNFPTTAGAFQRTFNGIYDNAFVTKVNVTGTALVYSTYLGGRTVAGQFSGNQARGIAVDTAGNAYVTGDTVSTAFPTTPGAFQRTLGSSHGPNAFITKLNAAATALVYSTYLGGSGYDQGFGIAVDAAGNAYVTGSGFSTDFPITPGAFQRTLGGSFDAFVTKLNATGTALVYSTYLGGSGTDFGFGIAVDGAGNAYVTGATTSTDFPTTSGAFQRTLGGSWGAFVAKVNDMGTALVYSTYLGGSNYEEAHGIAVDAAGNAYVTGLTQSRNFPTTPGAFQRTMSGLESAFVAKIAYAGPATHFGISVPVTPTSCNAFGIIVTALDAFNNTAIDYTGTAHFTSTDSMAALPGDYTFTAADHGVHGFSVTLCTAGSATLTARDTANGSITGNASFTVGATVDLHQIISFGGMTFSDTYGALEGHGISPPDTQGAAGPSHIVEVVNSTVAFLNKTTGAKDYQRPLQNFFSPVYGGLNIFDPVVTYDELANRFIIAALDKVNDIQQGQRSFLDLAVSNTSNPLDGFTEMHRIEVTQLSASGLPLWGDYPKLGFNADAVVVTMNMYPFCSGCGSDHVQVVTFDKATLLDRNPATLTRYHVNRDLTHFTMAAAAMHGASPGGPMWFVEEAGPRNGNTLRVVKMTNVLSPTPTFTDFPIPVTSYGVPPPFEEFEAAQPGSGLINAGDTRILNAALRGNRLVTSQTVGASGAAHARWYEFNLGGASPTLTQLGEINPGPGVNTYYPSIEIAANGDLGMTFMQSSAGQFMSMYVTGQGLEAPAGTMAAPILAQAGQASYSDYTGSPYRAGDYSGITVDPAGTTFWAANEYATAAAGNNWGTWIANFTPHGPFAAQLSVSAPDQVAAGSTFPITVRALDVCNNLVPSYRGTVHFTSTDGAATLPSDYTFTANDHGVHTFTVTLRTAGPRTLTARDTANAAVAGSAGVTVNSLAADHFAVSTPPSSTAGSPFDVIVRALDPYNNVDPSYAGTVTFTSSDPFATLPDDYTFTADDNGVHTFTVTLQTTDTQTITATDTVNSTITDSRSVQVNPAAPDHFRVMAPNSVTAGIRFDVIVVMQDAFNNTVTSYVGTVAFTSSDPDPGVRLPANYTFRVSDRGVHFFTNETILITPGDQTVTVTDTASGITGSVTITVNPGGGGSGGSGSGGGGGSDSGSVAFLPPEPISSGKDSIPTTKAGPLRSLDVGSVNCLFVATKLEDRRLTLSRVKRGTLLPMDEEWQDLLRSDTQ